MSEYQYYEFQALDRPLTAGEQKMLRGISSRAHITAASMTNSYNWGDFRGDEEALMAQCFDLHLYYASFCVRRVMIRLPLVAIDPAAIIETAGPILSGSFSPVKLTPAKGCLIVDVQRSEENNEWEYDENEGEGWLGRIAPIRGDLLAGDMRVFTLLWLMAAEDEGLADDVLEPAFGLGPLTEALKAFADYFVLDPDLVEAAAERPAAALEGSADPEAILAAMSAEDKDAYLLQVLKGDPHVGAALRSWARSQAPQKDGPPQRTLGELRQRAKEIEQARKQREAKAAEAERLRQEKAAAAARRKRLDALARRGESVWEQIEEEILRRNAPGYDKAAALLTDLAAIAKEQGDEVDFQRRLTDVRSRHGAKQRFLERITAL